MRRKPVPVLMLVFVAAMALAAPARAVSVDQIPSPRPAGWTVDLTQTLSPEAVRVLNHIGDEVKAQSGAEMAVVVVGSTDGVPPREFATRLFNRWGIGDRQADNGILLFAALDDRKTELLLGSGIDTEETRRISEEIMQGDMVPRFRDGDPGGALIRGADAAARRILRVSPSPLEAPAAVPAAPVSPVSPPGAASAVRPFSASPARNGYGWLWALAAALAGSGAWAWYRFVPPHCPDCRGRMARLSETGDDLHLEPPEQVEERIESVDYDVWMCGQCGTFKKTRHLRLLSGYRTCPKCRARTKSRVSVTLKDATEFQTGLVRIMEACAICDYRMTEDVVTPVVQRHHSSGSSSGSSGSGFSGGSSSGGGASGSW